MATDIIARGMITEYKSGTNISFKENDDGSVTISASGDVSSEDTVARDTIDNHKLDKNNPHNVTAEQVGLGNVNNTADLDKPISTAVQTALDDKANSKHTHNKSDITDFPNSLPANGGNADTVNGFGVAEYVTTLPEGEYYTEAARINTRDKKIESCDTSNLKVGLADYATNADYAINSNTVNNHTVDSDVPANAVFTDTTNSDVTIVGNPVQIDGLQGGVPFSEMVVSGKNLLPFPYYDTTKTVNGITFTDNGDGTITANGTATANAAFFLSSKIVYKSGVDYVISGCPNGGDRKFKIKGNSDGVNADDVGYGKTFSFSEDTECSVSILIYKDATVNNLVFRPQLELGDTPTAYEPPITGRELQVNVCGKNLMKPNKSTVTLNGITATMNDDGSITLSGTATANTYIFMWNILYAHNMGVGKIAVNAIDGQSISTYFMGIDRREGSSYIDRVAQSITNNGIGEITQEDVENGRNFTVWVRVAEGCTCNNLIIYPQLEIGSTATPYEPYHGAEYTITPNSNPYVIPNDIRQQEGLNVVSVSEGELSVTGVRKNAAFKRIWDEIDEIKTAIIVSNGETIE